MARYPTASLPQPHARPTSTPRTVSTSPRGEGEGQHLGGEPDRVGRRLRFSGQARRVPSGRAQPVPRGGRGSCRLLRPNPLCRSLLRTEAAFDCRDQLSPLQSVPGFLQFLAYRLDCCPHSALTHQFDCPRFEETQLASPYLWAKLQRAAHRQIQKLVHLPIIQPSARPTYRGKWDSLEPALSRDPSNYADGTILSAVSDRGGRR
jgi:hypothetical protein